MTRDFRPSNKNLPFVAQEQKRSLLSTHNYGGMVPQDVFEKSVFVADGYYERTAWLGATFDYFLPGKEYTNIVVFEHYDGEDLLHLRAKFPEAAITVFFPEEEKPVSLGMADVTDTRAVLRRELKPKYVEPCIRLAGGTPDLIVCRSPRIIEATPKSYLDIEYNEDRLQMVARWIQYAKKKGIDTLFTYLTNIEAAQAERRLKDHGVDAPIYVNPHIDEDLSFTVDCLTGPVIPGAPDYYVMRT